jgi:3-hydroxyisobutyrate dehydrogenase-like beta-hydroxyacid dehydrogenase
MKIAFLGAGAMGLPMARNLARAGHDVAAWNRTPSKAAPLAADGVRIAESIAEAAGDAEAAVTMLADDRAVEEALAGGLLDALPRGAVHVGMSTVGVAFSKRAAKEHAARGQGYVAAPVFGRPEAAAAKRLWVVAAGPPEHVARCAPLFEAVGRGVSVVGADPYAANVVKLAGNLTIMAAIEALGEAFALAKASGVDPRQLLEVVNSALFQSPLYANYGGIIAEKRFDPPGFRMQLGLKDAGLVSAAATALHVPMPLASLVHDRMLRAVAEGHGETDWAAFSSL